MKKWLLFCLLCIGLQTQAIAGKPKIKAWKAKLMFWQKQENPKVVASIICVAVGPFGAHRLYLGTDERVPIFYTLTLGGGLGVLPVVDLMHIVFTKDIDRFRNNPKVIMWMK